MTNQPELTKTQLRIASDIYLKVLEACKSSGRSMNAEITYRLEQSFAVANRDNHAADALATIIERLGDIEKQIGVSGSGVAAPARNKVAAKKSK